MELFKKLKDQYLDTKKMIPNQLCHEAAELEAARAETEVERIRLAACGVVAMSNTPDSAAKAREMLPEYRSGSLEDVIRAVDSEMELREQLAAEQAKNVGLRELVEHFALIDLGRSLLPDDFGLWVLRARKAIATPSDTSALEAIVKKAGEVMRLEAKEMILRELFHSTLRINLINKVCALPVVTLEDLK